jgi:hypothetical protein
LAARLVQLGPGGRRGAAVRLGREEVVIGRDAHEADLVVEDSTRVSRRHAVVRPVGPNWELVDLGSANGTALNGEPIQRARLADGDSILLGEDVELLFEVPRSGPPLGVVALVLLLAVAAGGAWWWRAQLPNPAMGQAAKLASEGVTAAEAGNPEMAKERFQAAAGLMFREGLLDDVERDVIMRTAMERIGTELGTHTDLWAVFKQTMQELAKRRQEEERREEARPGAVALAGSETPSCRLDAVSAEEYEPCLRQWIRKVLHELRQEPKDDLPKDFVSLIAERQCFEHGFIKRSIERGKEVVPMMCAELEKKYLPPLIHYLSMIESGYQSGALSSAAALGPWQFIPETGRRYGLHARPGGDDRRDFHKSTVAAAEYLNDLLMDFGGDSMLLALAGYNRGEQGVRNALRKLENPFSDRSYWRLVETGKLPKETACYVSRFLAAATAGEGGLPDPAVVNAYLGRPCSNKSCAH